ncbi:hypothetical protein [Massilia sp. UBA6681]|uniref:hypothetical protein n=1 Tax=Massilia sp. UBA6681 TaxID=1946839 RepID=UPI0025B83704|nr:hypothetical protein [Massilia sp. UBA6681]
MANYSSAAARHWSDAELLLENTRFDNADHLYGIAAECAVKTAIVTGHRVNDEQLPKKYWEHIDALWDLVPVQQLSRNYPGMVAIMKLANPFSDWRISNRYAVTGSVTTDAVEAHRSITRRLLTATQILGTRRERK